MKTQIIDLLTDSMAPVLEQYETFFGSMLSFGKFDPLHLTPEKHYSARTDIPVLSIDFDTLGDGKPKTEKVGNLVVIAFQSGDGTGSTEDYNPGTNEIPKEYVWLREGAIPREKKEGLVEGALPLFTFHRDHVHNFSMCLDELTFIRGEFVKKAWHIGLEQNDFELLRNDIQPSVNLTTGYNGQKRFGNPHSIVYPFKSDSIQVVGFLSSAEKDIVSRVLYDSGIKPAC